MVEAICTTTKLIIETGIKDFSVNNIRHIATTDALYQFGNAVNSLQITPVERMVKYQQFLLLSM